MRIVVLGMHRSGTSALTRILGMMGCHLGADDAFNPAAADNPKGYWERRDVWALNEEILSALGATWSNVGDLDLERIDAETRAGFEERARKIVAELDPRRPWAIKDPRLCLLLPLWLPALEQPVCIVTHRRPIQVAQSLKRRNGFPTLVGLALWEKYVRASLRNSDRLTRVLVDHARMIADPESTVRNLHRELDRAGVRGLRMPEGKAIREFIDPDLHRARRTAGDEDPLLTPGQRELAHSLDDGRALEDDPPQPAPPEIDELLRGYFELESDRDRNRAAAEQAISTRDVKAARVEELAAQLERTETLFSTADAELAQRSADLEQTKNRLKATEAERDEAFRERDAKSARIEELAARLEEVRAHIEALESELIAARTVSDELDHNLAVAVERAEALDDQLTAHRAKLDGALRRARRLEDELRTGLAYAGELQALIDLVLGSGRWWFANFAGEVVRRVSLRPRQPAAREHRDRIVSEVDAWRARLEKDHGIPSGD